MHWTLQRSVCRYLAHGKCKDRSNIPGNSSDCTVNCQKDGLSVCLDPALQCDMHPQCDGGEDEKDCSDTYVDQWTDQSECHVQLSVPTSQ